MSNEELAIMARDGDQDALIQLWNQIRNFVVKQALRWHNAVQGAGGADLEDYIQSGFLAMMNAVDSFDVERGKAFIGWLNMHLKTAFSKACGLHTKRDRQDPLNSALSLDAPLDEDGGESLENIVPALDDPIADAENRLYNEALREALDAAIKHLPSVNAAVIREIYFYGHKPEEIAANNGVSPLEVDHIKTKSLQRLRKPEITKELNAFIELRTSYYHHVGVQAFSATHTSAVEWITLQRERMEEQ